MKTTGDIRVQMIPVSSISVVNPRVRGRIKFQQIVSNIDQIGLKKPITVSRREGANGQAQYDLVCGQGRLEAYQALGQDTVPALVVDVSHENLLLMSLAENLARKRYKAAELVKEIGAMHERGHDFAEIARKTDLNVEYVRGIVRLLKSGEKRLLTAVENGQIPITIAITIASSDDEAVQRALAEAYDSKALRGKALLRARKLIDDRRVQAKSLSSNGTSTSQSVTAQNVMRVFQRQMNKHRLLVRKAKLTETRMLFVVTAMKSLLADENFVTVLRAEGLDTMPKDLAEQMNRKDVRHA